MSWSVIAAVVGLGVAGLDPVGALIVAGAIAAGARRRAVGVFFAASLLLTVGTGLLLGESVERLVAIVLESVAVPDWARLALQLVAGGALGAWALRRRARHAGQDENPGRQVRGSSTGAMLVAGVLWGVAALADPTFYATAAVAAGVDGVVVPSLLYAVWFVISQLPLCLVTGVYLVTGQGRLLTRLIAWSQRVGRVLGPVLTGLIALTALLLVASSLGYLLTGRFVPA